MRTIGMAVAVAVALAVWAPHARADDAAQYPPDNTGKNVRDRGGDTLTSGDQSESEHDLKVTQQVRKALVDDDSLSVNAHNVKVITTGGVVTLRGPVNSAEEKAKVNAAAARVAGVKRIDDQLEITTKGAADAP